MQEYIKVYVLSVVMNCFADLQRKFLNCLGIATVPMICQLIASLLHPVWAYLFTFQLGLGVVGIGIAGALTNSINLSLMLYLTYVNEEITDSVFFPDSRSFYGLSD